MKTPIKIILFTLISLATHSYSMEYNEVNVLIPCAGRAVKICVTQNTQVLAIKQILQAREDIPTAQQELRVINFDDLLINKTVGVSGDLPDNITLASIMDFYKTDNITVYLAINQDQ